MAVKDSVLSSPRPLAAVPRSQAEAWHSAVTAAAKVQARSTSDAEARIEATHAAALLLAALGKLPLSHTPINAELPALGQRMVARMLDMRQRLLNG